MKQPNVLPPTRFSLNCTLLLPKKAHKNRLRWILLILALIWGWSTVEIFSQGMAPTPPEKQLLVDCSSMTFTIEHYAPCCYRIHVNNTADCFPSLRVLLNAGSFAGWGASTQTGWTGTQISPTEIDLTHSSGQVPIGASTPMGFCLPPGLSPTLTIQYEFICTPAASCIAFFPLDGCPDPGDASITGVKYRACTPAPYSNQPVIPGWTMNLYDANNINIAQAQTDAAGSYAFYNLNAGTYTVKEEVKPGWTSSFPASGQAVKNLSPSQHAEQNFGNCPSCSCDSIYLHLSQVQGTSDTSKYYLDIANNGPYCFSYINVQFDTVAHMVDWNVLLPGWTATLQSPNLLKLNPPGPYIPTGGAIPLSFRLTGGIQHNISLSTYWSTGSNPAACTRTYVFSNPPTPLSTNCCPAGTVQGPELVVNGDFSSGNTGFTWSIPGYAYAAPTESGKLIVTTSAMVPAINSVWACASKSGLPTDQFLIVNGSTTPGAVAWQELVSVTPNTTYAFCAYFNNIFKPTLNDSDPIIEFRIVDINNNIVFASKPTTLAESPDIWVQLTGVWTSPQSISGQYKLQILSASNSGYGNDFALDCISFRKCGEPCQVSISITPIDNCGLVHAHGASTGPQPIHYQWCDGQSNSDLIVQTFCGPYTFCVTVTCADGSTSSATQVVDGYDKVPPTITCPPDLTLDCGDITTDLGEATATDNCGTPTLTHSNQITPTLCGSIVAVQWVATDFCGNTSSCVQSVTYQDIKPPMITCPPNLTFDCGDIPTNLGQATATDNCGVPTLANSSQVTPNACGSLVAKQWIADDGCGNTSFCVQTITFKDIKPPVISCPANTTVNTNPGHCFYTGSLPQPVVSDICDPNPSVLCYFEDNSGGAIYINAQTQLPKGITYIFCESADKCGNKAGCSFTLTVVDIEPPAITCPGSIMVMGTLNPDGQCKAVVNGIAPTSSDNCPMLNVTYSISGNTSGMGSNDASGTNFMQDISTVTYTATDMSGNAASCSFDVKVTCQPLVCTCGTFSNLTWNPVQGGPIYPVACGNTLTIGCPPPGFNLMIGGDFQCQGSNCLPIQLHWKLRQMPAGTVVATGNVLATPTFSVPLYPSFFTNPGNFEIEITGSCNGVSCPPCVFTINAQGCPCCTDYNGFLNLANMGFTITQTGCTVTVCTPQFSDCDWFTTQPDFYGSNSGCCGGAVHAKGCWSHTYKYNGIYHIRATVFENNCWSATLDASVTISCHPFGPSAISGVAYDASINGQCTQEPYSNQPTIPGIKVTLTDTSNTFIASVLTDNMGRYRFDSLPPGMYRLVENADSNWEYCIPASGIQTVALGPGELKINIAIGIPIKLGCVEACSGNRNWQQVSDVFYAQNTTPVIHAMTIFNGKLIVAGLFYQVGNLPANNIAAWDGSTWSALGNGITDNDYTGVTALAVRNGKLYAGGHFSTPGAGVAAWDGTSWNTLDGGAYSGFPIYGEVDALLNTPFGLVVGGHFNSVGSAFPLLANNIALWNDATNKWITYFGLGISNNGNNNNYPIPVQSLGLYKGNVVAGGSFTSPATNIAMFDQATSSWQPFGGGTNNDVKSILQNGNDLIVGGGFSFVTNVYGVPGTYGVARWDGSQWKSMASGSNGDIGVLKNFNGAIYAGGYFTAIGNVVANSVAKWDGANWTGTGHSLEGVQALEQYSPSGGTCDFYSGGYSGQNISAKILQRWSCTVGTSEPLKTGLRIFPNPNSGAFTIELTEPAAPGLTFRVIDLTGRLVLEIPAETGNTQQTVQATSLPAGLYFLQVVAERRVLAVEKFVKE